MSNSSQRPYKALGDVLLGAIGNGKTQKSIALCLHVSQVAVHNWLSGKRRPQPGTTGQLAALVGISPDYLADLAGYVDPDAREKLLGGYHDRLQLLAKAERK